MKKFFKWVLIGIGGLITLVVVVVVILSKTGYLEQQAHHYKGKAMRTNGKLLSASVYTSMQMLFLDTNSFPDKAGLMKELNAYGPIDDSYQIMLAADSPVIHKVCPDCAIQKETFKIAIVGNIDGDADEDILTIDHEKNLTLVQDDLGEQQTPVLLSSKETR